MGDLTGYEWNWKIKFAALIVFFLSQAGHIFHNVCCLRDELKKKNMPSLIRPEIVFFLFTWLLTVNNLTKKKNISGQDFNTLFFPFLFISFLFNLNCK